ncbi:MAG: UDP-2,4-diacetamido-2,4,6-trideoxy-beta-L-altropyranose hydrolase [Gammaproteobacteria bacterium]|nr:UDP-2,4-diacetamido-2,4,6-trideoxy-beta-L-altropyranose hydrolase [Gammaproteobacteria bacterium]
MKVVFRADASLQIGTGHVMRCLTLADALKSRGAEIVFICRAHAGHLKDKILAQGHQVCMLEIIENYQPTDRHVPNHASWLGVSWQQDAEETSDMLEGKEVDWIVVDHYALDIRWEAAVRKNNYRLMVIDDLADREHDCDVLLDQTFNRVVSSYKALVPDGCTILTGTDYALLRPEFAALREYSLQRRDALCLQRILITMGGVDQDNATAKVLDALRRCQLPGDCQISVIMGSAAPWLDSIRETAAHLPWDTEILVDVGNMSEVMAESDLCIGAAGSTAWERCCLGLPTLMVVLADNQKAIAKALEEAGACINLGDCSDKQFVEQAVPVINEYIANTAPHKLMINASSKVTDGKGIENVLRQLMSAG